MNWNRHQYWIIALFSFLWANGVLANPVVEGAHVDGANPSVLVLQGTGFGAHSNFSSTQSGFLAAGWHDFENQQLQGGNVFRDSQSPSQWTVDAQTPRAGSAAHAKKVFQNDELGELYVMQSGTTGIWYVSFWMHLNTPQNQQSGKFFRIYGANNNNIYLSTGGSSGFTLRGFSECSGCSPGPNTVWDSPTKFAGNTWHRVEIEMSANPDIFAVYLDGVLQWRRSSSLSGSERERWVPSNFGGNGHTIGIGQMLDAPDRGWPANGWYKFDDFYVSYTRSRVELSDSPTWASARKKEIQVPFEWNNGQIKFRLRKGAFGDQPLYVYVVDSAGNVNPNGFPVASIGNSPPTPPTGISVQ